jgi:hypothetical protein
VPRRFAHKVRVLANDAIKLEERTSRRSDRRESNQISASNARTPSSTPGTETRAGATRSPREQSFGLVKVTLFLLVGIAASGGFAAFVQETQVNKPLRNSNAQAPMPDHEKLTGVWLHPVLLEALKDENTINNLSDAHKLEESLAERGLSLAGPIPIVRLETAPIFDDPNVQARFGMKYSYTVRQSEQVVKILSALCGADDNSNDFPKVRDVPLYTMDMANLPEPMDAGAVLDLVYRRQEFGICRPCPPCSGREARHRPIVAIPCPTDRRTRAGFAGSSSPRLRPSPLCRETTEL